MNMPEEEVSAGGLERCSHSPVPVCEMYNKVTKTKDLYKKEKCQEVLVVEVPEVGMGHPAPNKDECERGIEEKPWRGREAEILGEVSKLLVRRKNLCQFRRCTHTTEERGS